MRLLTFLESLRLDEVPIQDIKTHGFDQPAMSMPAKDIQMLTKEKYWNVVRKKWSNAPYNYNLIFANIDLGELVRQNPQWTPEKIYTQKMMFTDRFTDLLTNFSGIVDPEVIELEWGLEVQSKPGIITAVFLSNADASEVAMRMTPWIMAHRLGHSVNDTIDDTIDDSYNLERLYLQQHFVPSVRLYAIEEWSEDYHHDIDQEEGEGKAEQLYGHEPDLVMELHYSIPYENLLTTKSARTGTILPGEQLPELIAQFILQGEVRLARPVPPKDEEDLVKFTNGYQMDDHYISWNGQEEAEWLEPHVEEVEKKTNEILNKLFTGWQRDGAVFVAP